MSKDLMSKNYGFEPSEKQQVDLVSVSENRAMHEVQASFVIAKKFPRDENESFAKIMKACKRPFLAEQSMYAYPKGGKVVDGPSIRLAEVLISAWGNCDFGIEEISQANGVSIARAFAIDFETNTRCQKIFHVPHILGTKSGPKKLTDPRDIYEHVANQGARRMRACILAIIPGDITDAAVEECKKTLTKGSEPLADRVRNMAVTFKEEFGIKIEQLEKRLGHKLDAVIEAEFVTLKSIYRSLRDGMAKREDFFDMGIESVANKSVNDLIDTKLKKHVSDPQETETFLKEYDSTEPVKNATAKDALKDIKEKLNS